MTDVTALPPLAEKRPLATVRHGETVVDDYAWLREKENPAVIAHLEAENAYADAALTPLEAFRDALYREMLGRIKQTDMQVPVRRGTHWYYSRTEEGRQYPIYCRRVGSADGPEQVVLDLNALAEGHPYLGLGVYNVSHDERRLLFSLDVTGFREFTLQVKDLVTGEVLPDRIEKARSAAWAADNRTIFYVLEDHAKRAYRLMRHELGTGVHEMVWEEPDELYRIAIDHTHDRKYLVLMSGSAETSECWVLPADRPRDAFRRILPREEGHEYSVEHRDGLWYLLTNKDAKNFRVVMAPLDDPRPERWTELIPHDPRVLIEGFDIFAGHLVAYEQEGALPHVRILDLATRSSRRLPCPDAVYSISGGANPEYDSRTFRYGYQAFTTPPTVSEIDMATFVSRVLKVQEVLGPFDPTAYVSERLWATAPDGVAVPISLVRRRDVPLDGSAPLLLYGYGAYGIGLSVTFVSTRLSLLDRGVIFALAHIRGGNDLGEGWHDDGKMLRKRNTFTDFIACAEHLIAERYTNPQRLAIKGGSAGGLLMGAVTNLRPDLFKAVVSLVPFVDVVNTMLDPTMPLTVGEYLEWGNPNEREAYDYIRSYCPYSNLRPGSYPAIYIRTSLNDSQVMYWEPAKYVAKLRTLKSNGTPLLLKTNMGAGHGGASGRYEALRDQALDDAWTLTQLGIVE